MIAPVSRGPWAARYRRIVGRSRGPRAAANVAIVMVALLLAGCRGPEMRTPTASIARGDYGVARTELHRELRDDPHGGEYLLDRIRVGVLTLADGYPHAASLIFQQVYEVLRQQGLNRDRALQAVVLNEDTKIWKGEPFEQALGMAYYALTMAELGSWDNARAALENAHLFLRDLERDQARESRLDAREVARRSAVYEELVAEGVEPEEAYRRSQAPATREAPDFGYVVDRNHFPLGYLLAGVANQQLDRDDEASDHFTRAVQIDPSLGPLVETLRRGEYNTILVVSWGLGPRRQGVGEDRSRIAYIHRASSDTRPMLVRVGGEETRTLPLALDVNELASRYTWGGLAGVRGTKSAAGSGLLVGGVGAAAIGANAGSDELLVAGLAAMATGAFLKAGAHIDPRYVDVYPQRYYLVPLRLTDRPEPIQVMIDGSPASRIVLHGLAAPRGREAQLRYVRLVSPPQRVPPDWAVSDGVYYANPHTRHDADDRPLPYLLGGRDVRHPTERVMDDYWSAGYLRDLTLSDLRELYRLEGVDLSREEDGQYPGLHLLEGGDSLVAPLPGTAGFARIFGQPHAGYTPRSQAVAQLKEQIDGAEATSVTWGDDSPASRARERSYAGTGAE